MNSSSASAMMQFLSSEGWNENQWLSEAVPLLADLLSVPTSDRYPHLDLTSQKRKEKTLTALLAQLEGLAARQPVLMVVEDTHWSDPTTLELLDLTVDRSASLPVLLLITYRPEPRPGSGAHMWRPMQLPRARLVGCEAGLRRVVEKIIGEEFVEHIEVPATLYFLGIAANDCLCRFALVVNSHDLLRWIEVSVRPPTIWVWLPSLRSPIKKATLAALSIDCIVG
jgi:hypothetical protein